MSAEEPQKCIIEQMGSHGIAASTSIPWIGATHAGRSVSVEMHLLFLVKPDTFYDLVPFADHLWSDSVLCLLETIINTLPYEDP